MSGNPDTKALAGATGTAVTALGAVFAAAGAATWVAVSTGLRRERITVASDARHFAGTVVTSPWAAWSEVEAIARHTDEMTGGKTYAELDRSDPRRKAAMDGSLLRSALLTSVVGFGVAAAVTGIGVGFAAIGYGLRKAASGA